MKIRNRRLLVVAIATVALIGIGASLNGCNMYGGIDTPQSKEELLASGQALMDEGKCSDAVTKLSAIGDKDNKVLSALGWAHLCTAGATIAKVGKTLFKYSSSTNDLTIVGQLADSLIPMSAAGITAVGNAITTFSSQAAGQERSFNLAFANIIKAAAIIAQRSADNVRARRSDMVASSSACTAATCTTNPAACAAGMTDADADAVATALSSASSNASAAGLGAGSDLSRQLGSIVNYGFQNTTRCAIVQQMIAP